MTECILMASVTEKTLYDSIGSDLQVVSYKRIQRVTIDATRKDYITIIAYVYTLLQTK